MFDYLSLPSRAALRDSVFHGFLGIMLGSVGASLLFVLAIVLGS